MSTRKNNNSITARHEHQRSKTSLHHCSNDSTDQSSPLCGSDFSGLLRQEQEKKKERIPLSHLAHSVSRTCTSGIPPPPLSRPRALFIQSSALSCVSHKREREEENKFPSPVSCPYLCACVCERAYLRQESAEHSAIVSVCVCRILSSCSPIKQHHHLTLLSPERVA